MEVSRQPLSRRHWGAFTLIELLVVVAIISLLMALLLPSLSQAREQGRSGKCKANLHALVLGYISYSAAYGYTGTPGAGQWGYSVDSSGKCNPKGGWMGANVSGYECPTLAGAVPPIMNSVSLGCVQSDPTTWLSIGYGGSAVSYGQNSVKIFAENPAETVAYADMIFCANHTLVRPWNGGILYSPTFLTPNIHGRHLGKANVSWYDGHVSAERPFIQSVQSDISQTYAGAGQVFYAADLVSNNVGQLTQLPLTTTQSDFFKCAKGLMQPSPDYYFWPDKTNRR